MVFAVIKTGGKQYLVEAGRKIKIEKISHDKEPLEAANNATAHLYISNPFKDKITGSWFYYRKNNVREYVVISARLFEAQIGHSHKYADKIRFGNQNSPCSQ